MSKKSKWFVVATEGATSDGRAIDRAMIEQMAANYDPKKYGARVNLEHYRGIDPDGLFRAYGDVEALKTETRDGKLVLLALVNPTDDLVGLAKKRQKIYTSIEINPNFADTNQAYLQGLAVTDSPASLGTEMLEFSAQKGAASPLAGRKASPGNLFTAAQETAIEFDDAGESASITLLSTAISALASIAEKFSKPAQAIPPVQEGTPAAVVAGEASADIGKFMAKTVKLLGDLQGEVVAKADFTALQDKHNQLQQEFAALHGKLEAETPQTYSHRQPATGGNGTVLTDC